MGRPQHSPWDGVLGVNRSEGAMARPVYELGARRTIVRDGLPLLTLTRWRRPLQEGGGYSLSPLEADELAAKIVALLNSAAGPIR